MKKYLLTIALSIILVGISPTTTNAAPTQVDSGMIAKAKIDSVSQHYTAIILPELIALTKKDNIGGVTYSSIATMITAFLGFIAWLIITIKKFIRDSTHQEATLNENKMQTAHLETIAATKP
jgi:hypothetical protein